MPSTEKCSSALMWLVNKGYPARPYADAVDSLELFFRSGWYGMLTDLDGEYLMTAVRRMEREEVAA